MFTNFDPQIKITASDTKFFEEDSSLISKLQNLDCIQGVSCTIQDQVLISFNSLQQIITLKGVDGQFAQITGINNILLGPGEFMLRDQITDYIILGAGLAQALQTGAVTSEPYTIYAPKPGVRPSTINPANALNSRTLYTPGVLFAVNQAPYDNQYALAHIEVVQNLLGRENKLSAIEIRLTQGASVKKAIRQIKDITGDQFLVADQYTQQHDVFRVMKVEKLISYLFVILILLIALFNIVSSIIMLIIEKKEDMKTLSKMGTGIKSIANIFGFYSIMESLAGCIGGMVIATIIILLQQNLGFIPLGTDGEFIVQAYPVHLKITDILIVLSTVLAVSLISLYIIRWIVYKFFRENLCH